MQGAFGNMQGQMGLQGGPAQMSAGGYPKPSTRNPIMALLLPWLVMIGGDIVFVGLGSVLGVGILVAVGQLFILAGAVLYLMGVIKMANELKAVTRNEAFAWWPMIIPIYQLIWSFSIVPQEMAKAKQIANVQTPVRSGILYLLFLPLAFASDLNDIAAAP